MVQTPKTYKCSASTTTDAGWPRKRAHLGLDKNLSFCNQKTDSHLHLYVYSCVWSQRWSGALFSFVWPEICNSAVCKMSCPTHRYANVQISAVTTPFDLSCVNHCNLLLNIFTIVNYRYMVVPRINGLLCKKRIIKFVPLSLCGTYIIMRSKVTAL